MPLARASYLACTGDLCPVEELALCLARSPLPAAHWRMDGWMARADGARPRSIKHGNVGRENCFVITFCSQTSFIGFLLLVVVFCFPLFFSSGFLFFLGVTFSPRSLSSISAPKLWCWWWEAVGKIRPEHRRSLNLLWPSFRQSSLPFEAW